MDCRNKPIAMLSKEDRSIYNREVYVNNREHVMRAVKKYQNSHRQLIRQRNKNYYKANKAKIQAQRKAKYDSLTSEEKERVKIKRKEYNNNYIANMSDEQRDKNRKKTRE